MLVLALYIQQVEEVRAGTTGAVPYYSLALTLSHPAPPRIQFISSPFSSFRGLSIYITMVSFVCICVSFEHCPECFMIMKLIFGLKVRTTSWSNGFLNESYLPICQWYQFYVKLRHVIYRLRNYQESSNLDNLTLSFYFIGPSWSTPGASWGLQKKLLCTRVCVPRMREENHCERRGRLRELVLWPCTLHR